MSEVQITNSTTNSTAPKPIQRVDRTGVQNRRSFTNNRENSSGSSMNQRSNKPSFGGRNDRNNARSGGRNDRRQQKIQEEPLYESKVIDIRRVTRVVKGGKRMRVSALVVVGDRNGKVGFGLKKGIDFADAVAKATRKATNSVIKVNLDKNKSILFTSNTKHKSAEIFLKPALGGTGLIAGGFVRPVLELAGVENVYSKINRTRNKIPGVQCVIKALLKYSSNNKL
jgi:small subunit ribosomal protein S5